MAGDWNIGELAKLSLERIGCSSILQRSNLYESCESPAEVNLLDGLLKSYTADQITPQVHVGRYRIDFVTSDNVAWEVDGKDYHDYRRDKARDKWILSNSQINRIIRIEAGAMYHFRDPCLALFGCYVPGFNRVWTDRCLNASQSLEQANAYCQHFAEYGFCDEIEQFGELEAYDARATGIGYVGSPLAMLEGHPIWNYSPRRDDGRHSWRGKVFNRTLQLLG